MLEIFLMAGCAAGLYFVWNIVLMIMGWDPESRELEAKLAANDLRLAVKRARLQRSRRYAQEHDQWTADFQALAGHTACPVCSGVNTGRHFSS